MSDLPPIGSPEPEHKASAVSEKLLNPKTVAGLVIAVLAIWFIIANNVHTRVHLWVFWVSARLWVVLLGTFIAGGAAGWLLKRRTAKH
jgi:uncharacterized integral membrane protein